MAVSIYKGWRRKSRDLLQHRHASRNEGKVGAKSELWVSPTGCVWKHDTLCRPTLALSRRPPGLERNAGRRRAWQHRVSLWPAGVAKTYKRLVQGHHVCYKWISHGKGLPNVSSPSVMLNLPNPHRHLP